jgi:hypothetical protein
MFWNSKDKWQLSFWHLICKVFELLNFEQFLLFWSHLQLNRKSVWLWSCARWDKTRSSAHLTCAWRLAGREIIARVGQLQIQKHREMRPPEMWGKQFSTRKTFNSHPKQEKLFHNLVDIWYDFWICRFALDLRHKCFALIARARVLLLKGTHQNRKRRLLCTIAQQPLDFGTCSFSKGANSPRGKELDQNSNDTKIQTTQVFYLYSFICQQKIVHFYVGMLRIVAGKKSSLFLLKFSWFLVVFQLKKSLISKFFGIFKYDFGHFFVIFKYLCWQKWKFESRKFNTDWYS